MKNKIIKIKLHILSFSTLYLRKYAFNHSKKNVSTYLRQKHLSLSLFFFYKVSLLKWLLNEYALKATVAVFPLTCLM